MIRNHQLLLYKYKVVDNSFGNYKKCIENDVEAMIHNSTSNIFNEPQLGFQVNHDQLNFLFLQDIFYASEYSPAQDNPFHQEQEPHFTDPFQETQNQPQHTHIDGQTETPNESTKPIFKSSSTKNACFNICQKTIKVIKKGIFQDKLEQISQKEGINSEQFKTLIVKKKKDFTGPKALSSYLQRNTKQTRVFAEFMKWFLSEKYLRMAINEGEMKDLKKYIEFKNLYILPLLN